MTEAEGASGVEKLDGSGTGRRPLRLRLLLTVFLAEAALLLWIIVRDPMLAASVWGSFGALGRPPPGADLAAMVKNDPPRGTVVPEVAAMRPRAARGYVVVPVGDCASCMHTDVHAVEVGSAKAGLSMVIVSGAGPAVIVKFRKEARIACPVLRDANGALQARLNAVWWGRVYLFTSAGKLVWVQPNYAGTYDPFTDAGFRAAEQRLPR